MPTLARWYIKTSFAWLALALLLGVVSVILPASWPSAAFAPVQMHAFVVGWITQLIFGVVYWMFPKASTEHPRGSEGLAAATYVLLNAGLAARAVGEPMAALGGPGALWLIGSALMQWLAGLGFVLNTWPRVKGG
ncbi:MAG TPA: hypothetical protein VLD63_00215 [Anaerolineales bacterium]|nr:hypothetical protein [Anaerolineales bacterium]